MTDTFFPWDPQTNISTIWEDIHHYAYILGNACVSNPYTKGARLYRSVVKISQAAMADQPHVFNDTPADHGLEEVPELADCFRPDPGAGTLFALPMEEGGVVITTSGPGQVVRFRPDGVKLYTIDLRLGRHNNAFYLCTSPLQGGVTLLLDQYYRIVNIDGEGVIKNDLAMPMPFITSIHFDAQRERFHVCSAASGVCAIYDPLWNLQSVYEKWPLSTERKSPLRLFYDPYREGFWVVLGLQGSVYPLSLVMYDHDGQFSGKIVHLPIAGTNAVTCTDTLGRFHMCCKRTETSMFDALGRPIAGTPLPQCRSLQTRGDTLFAVGRVDLKLRIFSMKNSYSDNVKEEGSP